MEKISVIIVNWNVAESFARCVKSVLDTKYPNLKLILIDNNSDQKPVIPKDKRIISIQNFTNIGLPRAWNQGLQKAMGDYILILNPDTRLPKDFFTKAIEYFKSHPDAGVLGPKFTNPDGTPQGSVFPEPSVISAIREYWLGQKGLTRKYTPHNSQPTTVSSISGACLFLPKSTIVRIGKFTEAVFMYYEDLDYCRRLRRAGLKIIFHPGITIIHEHGQSVQQTSPEKYRNFLEIIFYPFRKFLKNYSTLPSGQRYRTEAGMWYNGWLKQLIIAFIIWSSERTQRLVAGLKK